MANTDSRQLHIYRRPVYQKRIMSPDHYISIPHTRCPSPQISIPRSRRRHSTPPASARRLLEDLSPPSNKYLRYYYPNVKPTRVSRELSSTSDSIKSTPSSFRLIKRRYQEERNGYISTTSSSIASTTDAVLPIAKKNLSTIIDIPSQIKPDHQSDNYEPPSKCQEQKCEESNSLDVERHVVLSHDETSEYSSGNYIHKPKRTKSSKWYHGKCLFQLLSLNFCSKCYHRCPLFCWSLCFLLIIVLVIGILLSIGFLST